MSKIRADRSGYRASVGTNDEDDGGGELRSRQLLPPRSEVRDLHRVYVFAPRLRRRSGVVGRIHPFAFEIRQMNASGRDLVHRLFEDVPIENADVAELPDLDRPGDL